MKKESFIDEIKRVPADVVQKLVDGENISTCVKLLQGYEEYADVEKSILEELILTSFSLVMNEKDAVYSEPYCKMYEIITAGNENVCEKCQKKEGKRHRIDKRKAGVNFPPFHLGCKCSAIFE